MRRRLTRSVLLSRLGIHDWQSLPDGRRSEYAIEVACSRCGRHKMMAVNSSHERGGPV